MSYGPKKEKRRTLYDDYEPISPPKTNEEWMAGFKEGSIDISHLKFPEDREIDSLERDLKKFDIIKLRRLRNEAEKRWIKTDLRALKAAVVRQLRRKDLDFTKRGRLQRMLWQIDQRLDIIEGLK